MLKTIEPLNPFKEIMHMTLNKNSDVYLCTILQMGGKSLHFKKGENSKSLITTYLFLSWHCLLASIIIKLLAMLNDCRHNCVYSIQLLKCN